MDTWHKSIIESNKNIGLCFIGGDFFPNIFYMNMRRFFINKLVGPIYAQFS